MNYEHTSNGRPVILVWLGLDLVALVLFATALHLAHWWQIQSSSLITDAVTAIVGFVCGLFACFAVHEWGHWLGARLAGAKIPFQPYNQAIKGYASGYRLIPNIDIEAITPRQYIWTTWWSVLGYLGFVLVALQVYLSGIIGVPGAAFAIGALGFAGQSLVLDMPPVMDVTRGRSIAETVQRRLSPKQVRIKSILGYSGAALVVIAWNLI